MISKTCQKFCKEDISKIENYEEAIADTSHTWVCHHILGEILTKEQLLEHDFYYHVPACLLKFVTRAEHRRIHNMYISEEIRRKLSNSMKGKNKGKTHSEETKKKQSESLKGVNTWSKGKVVSAETRRKISETLRGKMKGVRKSEEHRRKISELHKGKTWKVINGKRVWFLKVGGNV